MNQEVKSRQPLTASFMQVVSIHKRASCTNTGSRRYTNNTLLLDVEDSSGTALILKLVEQQEQGLYAELPSFCVTGWACMLCKCGCSQKSWHPHTCGLTLPTHRCIRVGPSAAVEDDLMGLPHGPCRHLAVRCCKYHGHISTWMTCTIRRKLPYSLTPTTKQVQVWSNRAAIHVV